MWITNFMCCNPYRIWKWKWDRSGKHSIGIQAMHSTEVASETGDSTKTSHKVSTKQDVIFSNLWATPTTVRRGMLWSALQPLLRSRCTYFTASWESCWTILLGALPQAVFIKLWITVVILQSPEADAHSSSHTIPTAVTPTKQMAVPEQRPIPIQSRRWCILHLRITYLQAIYPIST